ncbi:ATP-dependent DNA helicase RecG [Mariprofundus ferrinatatus]|uniref:ATP-dependent DNA helicase RecG n=1 Tax=Mariprofundus ferrinatatus TaxID=1921087 RepID=A0A2K8L878_9PROT|nr:ATP-dependent DNA helicase RecG [Mariprofundus ferrinatatus]ATX82071.1 ATP-dependent DNA helicase RecG [Mariprofundus ferrinatatus]
MLVECVTSIVQDKAMYDYLAQPLTRIPGVGTALEKRFIARGIACLGDLLLHLPKEYVDDRHICSITRLQEGASARIIGRIVSKQARGFGRNRQVCIRLADDTGQISLNFFHSGYMMSDARLSEGREISVRGVAERWKGYWQMSHPEWCVTESFQPGFQPVYASLAGLGGRRVGSIVSQALSLIPDTLKSPLDQRLAEQFHLPAMLQAFRQIHHPDSIGHEMLERAIGRLKSEEIIIYLHLMREKKLKAVSPAAALTDGIKSQSMLEEFPFPLTEAQELVWSDISSDLESGSRMHRLLQGDVGAGKTWIAALAMAKVAGSGSQAALLAPTEVLANQHAETLQALFSPLEMEVALLTGSTRSRARREMVGRLQDGSLQLIVGTHALLSEDVQFKHLALALVDEQHRFGVKQRWALAEKTSGNHGAVHLLGMTATPIPRSLALALYGDMDLSIMRGMPPGRKPVETRVIAAEKMKPLAEGMKRILDAEGRIYWIVPRIDEDEDGISVDQRVELLKRYFPDASVIGLHGRMKARDKNSALEAFSSGACKILVSTTVVEVGVNVPEARLIVIEQAENYGLAQLHQLRGRVGRSSDQGYCMLVAGSDVSDASMARLKKMVNCHDGLELAEADLAIRGGGDAVGTRQHGNAGFRLLDTAGDAALIRQWYANLPDFAPDESMQRFWRPFAEATD